MTEQSLRDVFHLVKQILPEAQEVVSVSPDTTAREALELLKKHGFDRLPVIAGNEVIGVFSYRSFAQEIPQIPQRVKDPAGLSVIEFVQDLPFAKITDDISVLLNAFDVNDAVLIGSEERLWGIVTTIDALLYFYRVASPYILLREIELSMRELIRLVTCGDQLADCAHASLKHYAEAGRDTPTTLERMTFNDHVQLICNSDTWDLFAPSFGKNREMVRAKLASLSILRNDVFHFRRDLSWDEHDTLRTTRDWLLRRVRIAENGGVECP